METWLKWSTLLLTAVAVMVIAGQDPVILDGKKRRVEVPFNSPLNLYCNLNTEGYERFWLKWYFNPYGSSFNETRKLSEKVFNRSAKTEENVLIHTLNATEKDNGWYFCGVTREIPSLITFNSSGTEVVITESLEKTKHPPTPVVTVTQDSPEVRSPHFNWRLWLPVGLSSFILIVLLVICILLRRKCRRSRAEDPVYANTRPVANKQPSPRPGMQVNHLKMGTSSQNLWNSSPGRRYEEGKQRYKE